MAIFADMKFITLGGWGLVLGSILLLKSNLNNWEVEQRGTLVSMKIIKLPGSCLGTRVNHFVSLQYGSQTFIKKIGGQFCEEHHAGEEIDMKYLEGNDEVLFPHESALTNLLSFVLLALIGVWILVCQWRAS